MQVKLVAVTNPIIDECEGPEEFIAYAAKVSNPSGQSNLDNAHKLISYLIKHKHWSPFEMVSATMEIKTTRDIARQILRHRSFSFQEFSQRYAQATEFVVDREARLQDIKNRQNSIKVDNPDLQAWWLHAQKHAAEYAEETYKQALKNGIAKEQARTVLPEGLTVSKLYMTGTLRSWIHYCDLRMGHGTQLEHMEIAKACWEELRWDFPNIIKAVEENGA
jgi:thymidylate synthase (FAD)